MTNLAFLKRRVTRGLVRDDIDPEEMAGWVSSATGRLCQELRVREMITHVSIPLTKNEFTLPPGFISVSNISVRPIGQTSRGSSLTYMSPDDLSRYQVNQQCPTPIGYSLLGRKIAVSPFSVLNYELDLYYFRRIDQLIEDDDTNIILTNYPDIYFGATMIFGHQFYLEYDMADKREARLMIDIDRVNTNFKMEKYGDGELIVPPAKRIGGRFS